MYSKSNTRCVYAHYPCIYRHRDDRKKLINFQAYYVKWFFIYFAFQSIVFQSLVWNSNCGNLYSGCVKHTDFNINFCTLVFSEVIAVSTWALDHCTFLFASLLMEENEQSKKYLTKSLWTSSNISTSFCIDICCIAVDFRSCNDLYKSFYFVTSAL